MSKSSSITKIRLLQDVISLLDIVSSYKSQLLQSQFGKSDCMPHLVRVLAKLFSVGTEKQGNDGNIWIIKETKNGIKQWKKQ